ncbi:hypothetical protein F8M41_014508 [Gigaspora margarita]|uniref:Uncharacterized protein n=1 Tax=Gigaspora margarita TaxID=4874 RepID=A0A8H3ZZU4_GIGMA|nr:hypothetical protein F8M41_014508 [Gigaspora margarita]
MQNNDRRRILLIAVVTEVTGVNVNTNKNFTPLLNTPAWLIFMSYVGPDTENDPTNEHITISDNNSDDILCPLPDQLDGMSKPIKMELKLPLNGDFNFKIDSKTIDTPDTVFTPKKIYDNLTEQQCRTFKCEPFSQISP